MCWLCTGQSARGRKKWRNAWEEMICRELCQCSQDASAAAVHPIRKTNCHFVSKLYLETNESMTEEERRNVGMTAGGGLKAGSTDEQHFSENPTIHPGQQPTSWRVLATLGVWARTECCIPLFLTRLSPTYQLGTGGSVKTKQERMRGKTTGCLYTQDGGMPKPGIIFRKKIISGISKLKFTPSWLSLRKARSRLFRIIFIKDLGSRLEQEVQTKSYLCSVLESDHCGVLHVLPAGRLRRLHQVAERRGDIFHGVDQHHLENVVGSGLCLLALSLPYLSFLVLRAKAGSSILDHLTQPDNGGDCILGGDRQLLLRRRCSGNQSLCVLHQRFRCLQDVLSVIWGQACVSVWTGRCECRKNRTGRVSYRMCGILYFW